MNKSAAGLSLFLLTSAFSASTAHAGLCPAVMIILDRSGSMDSDPKGGSTTPSKLDIAKMAINGLVDKQGDRLPLGYMTFESDSSDCTSGIDVLVSPKKGATAAIKHFVSATVSGGTTNTGPAVDRALTDPAMMDSRRPSAYIVLITDGEPNCAGTVSSMNDDPQYTIDAIKAAANKNVKTFVIGFGALPADAKTTMNKMAMAGAAPCTGMSCNGNQFYAAESATALLDAIDAIGGEIVGEFGGQCDDSCYATPCEPGKICVRDPTTNDGVCAPDPCDGKQELCASQGGYCYTDGTSPGTCVQPCPTMCAVGEICQMGKCISDPCLSVSCGDGQVCNAGSCVANTCANNTCPAGQMCRGGSCQDDPCRYVKCPNNTMCVNGTGACVGSGMGGPGTINSSTGSKRAGAGCAYVAPAAADWAPLVVSLIVLAFLLRRRLRGI